MVTPALPHIEQALTLKKGEVEWIVSVFLVGYLMGQLIYGPLANGYGRLQALKWGLNINLFGLCLCLTSGLFHSYLLLLIGRLVTGLGAAAGLTCTFILINEWLPEEQRKKTIASAMLSFAIAVGLSVFLGGIITQYLSWQGCFILLLLQGIIMRLGVAAFEETSVIIQKFHFQRMLNDYARALYSPQLFLFSLIWGTCTAAGYCYSTAAPQIAHQYLHVGASRYGYWNALNILGMVIGGLSARFLLHHFSVIKIIGIGYAGAAIAICSLTSLFWTMNYSAFWFFFSTALLYCFSTYLFVGGSYMASDAIEDKASAASIMTFINMGVGTLSVVIMGYLSSNPLLNYLLILASVFCITTTLFICLVVQKGRLKKTQTLPVKPSSQVNI